MSRLPRRGCQLRGLWWGWGGLWLTRGNACDRGNNMSQDKTQVSFLLDAEDMAMLRELAWLARMPIAAYLRAIVRQEGEKQGVKPAGDK